MTIGSLFSGVGGLELGLEWAGLGPTIWQVEQSDFCRAVLAKHWPEVDRSVTDVRLASSSNLVPVDVLCGGFPCVDVSAAGKGAGLHAPRSGLWFEYLRVVTELRPRIVVVENVESGARRWLCEVRSCLQELGYRTRAMGISAADVGAPHLRKRIFVVAHADGLRGVEPEGRECDKWGRSPDSGDRDRGEALGNAWSAGRSRASGARVHDERKGAATESGRRLGEVERGVGRDFDGSADWMDGHRSAADSPMRATGEMRWPAGRGEVQHDWEPPRTVTDRPPNRRARVKALGNAVVPQCSYVVGLVVQQILQEAP